MSITIYAWVGEDESGNFGVCSFVSPWGPSAAAFSNKEVALKYADQMQVRADILRKEVYLVKLATKDENEPVTTITPSTTE